MGDNLELVPPHSMEAEQALLGAIFLDPNLLGPCRRIIRHRQMFYREAHRLIWDAVLALFDSGAKSIDWITVGDWLEKHGALEAADGRAYVEEITNVAPLAEGAEQYAAIIASKAKLRGIATIMSLLRGKAYDPSAEPDEVYTSAVTELGKLDAMTRPLSDNSSTRTQRAVDWLRSLTDPNSTDVIFCGHPVIDQGAFGFNRGTLSQLIGPSGSGKTFFAHQLLVRTNQIHGTKCGMIQGEMKDYLLLTRQAAGHVAMKAALRIADSTRRGEDPSPSDMREVQAGERRIEAVAPHMYEIVCPESMELEVVENHIRELAEKDCALIVVDYLQRISLGNKEGPEASKRIVSSLKALAIKLNVSLCFLSQVTIATARDTKKTLWDLNKFDAYGGINMVNDFDMIATVFRPCKCPDGRFDGIKVLLGDKAAYGVCVVNISKARMGEDGLTAFWLNKNTEIGLTLDVPSPSVESALRNAARLGTEDNEENTERPAF